MLLAIQSHLKCLNMNFRFKCFKSSVHSRFSSERRKTWCDRLVSEVNIEKSKWHDRMNQREKQTLIDLLDLRYPHEWFPEARKQKRTLHCHLGGTNSGKTHSAVEALMNSNRGVYCAPLRLLAMEMWERIRLKSPCHLITGEIRIDAASPTRPKLDDSTCTSEDNSKCFLNLENIQKTDKEHVSCTVEMLDFAKSYDVAIIDEIQMVSDPQRGWAFTQALLGVNAKDVYLCGEEAILPIIESIAAMTGDTVTVKRFERLSPLTVESSSLKGNLSALLPGDCVVTFSRNSIFEARDLIFRETGRKCATVYGRLPLENRALQARLFNERLDKCDILVASDAIGMGLNLNISRIVFLTTKKSSPSLGRESDVPINLIKQIAGRAGRFGIGRGQGSVTALNVKDLRYIQKAMLEPNKPYQKAMIQPLPDMIIGISSKYPSLSLVSLLDAISESGTGIKEDADKSHFQLQVSFSEDQMCIAYLVDRYPSLTLREKLVLSTAPVPIKNSETELAHAFEHYLTYLNSRKTVPPYLNSLDSRTSSEALRNLETRFKITDLYLWLANRFPEYFVAVNDVLSMREDCTAKIDAILR